MAGCGRVFLLGVAAKHNGAATIIHITALNNVTVARTGVLRQICQQELALLLLLRSASVLWFSTCNAADKLFFSSLHYDKSGQAVCRSAPRT